MADTALRKDTRLKNKKKRDRSSRNRRTRLSLIEYPIKHAEGKKEGKTQKVGRGKNRV